MSHITGGHLTGTMSAVNESIVSRLLKIGRVTFPEFTGEKIYMLDFQRNKLPPELSRWRETIELMMSIFPLDACGWIMIDQGVVESGQTHRRPGPHVDGHWIDDLHRHHRDAGQRAFDAYMRKELLVMASDVAACIAYTGTFSGTPGFGGDCARLDLSSAKKTLLEANIAYAGEAMTLVHESIPVVRDCQRTLVRINLQDQQIQWPE